MKNRWLIGGLVVAAAALAVYFTVAEKKSKPGEPPPQAEASPQVPTAPTAPVVLPAVVDVLDIDPLLDPPPIPPSDPAGVTPGTAVVIAMDDEPPAVTPPVNAAPPAIPPAVVDEPAPGEDGDEESVQDDEPAVEVAPMPREVVVHPLPIPATADEARRLWYGSDRLPQQLGVGLSPQEWEQELRQLHNPHGPVGIGLYF